METILKEKETQNWDLREPFKTSSSSTFTERVGIELALRKITWVSYIFIPWGKMPLWCQCPPSSFHGYIKGSHKQLSLPHTSSSYMPINIVKFSPFSPGENIRWKGGDVKLSRINIEIERTRRGRRKKRKGGLKG